MIHPRLSTNEMMPGSAGDAPRLDRAATTSRGCLVVPTANRGEAALLLRRLRRLHRRGRRERVSERREAVGGA